MVNKLWYEDVDKEALLTERNYIQKFINLYFFNFEKFKVVEDITPENLGEFLEVILKHYEYYHFHIGDLYNLAGDSLGVYFHRAYMDDFPDTLFPEYPENDKRNLALYALDYIGKPGYTIFPEDVPYLIAYLRTSDSEMVGANKKIKEYLDQFDHDKRNNEEEPKLWEAICRERIEAIQNNKPLPIKPMSIELSMCYKDNSGS